jgi:transporter family protein
MNAILWAILTACIWGVVPVLEKLGLAKTEPFTALFFRCLGVIIGIVLLGTIIVKPHQMKQVDPKAIGLLVLSGFLASFVAQIAFYHGLKIGEVSRVVPISGTYPLIAFLLGIFVLGEAVTVHKIIGMLLVISGVWLLRF